MRTLYGAVATVCIVAQSAHAAPSGGADVQTAQARVATLASRLSGLLLELQEASDASAAASGNLAIARLRIDRGRERAADAKYLLDAQAREAYIWGRLRQTHLLLNAKDLRHALTMGSYIGASMQKDAAALAKYTAAIEQIEAGQGAIDAERSVLQTNTRRLADLRKQVQQALDSQRQVLDAARAEMARLSELRRRELNRGPVSLVVQARRSARQRVLDVKLAALLSWLAGNADQGLSSTGIVSTGLASWYGPGFDGRRSSSGATYHQEQMTAASLVLPFGTILKVTYNARSVFVVITDRGPYVAPRVLDLSAGASIALGHSGVKTVRMEIMIPVVPAPPFP